MNEWHDLFPQGSQSLVNKTEDGANTELYPKGYRSSEERHLTQREAWEDPTEKRRSVPNPAG